MPYPMALQDLMASGGRQQEQLPMIPPPLPPPPHRILPLLRLRSIVKHSTTSRINRLAHLLLAQVLPTNSYRLVLPSTRALA